MFSQRDGYNNMFFVLISKFDSWNLWHVLYRSHICGGGVEKSQARTQAISTSYTHKPAKARVGAY